MSNTAATLPSFTAFSHRIAEDATCYFQSCEAIAASFYDYATRTYVTVHRSAMDRMEGIMGLAALIELVVSEGGQGSNCEVR